MSDEEEMVKFWQCMAKEVEAVIKLETYVALKKNLRGIDRGMGESKLGEWV